MRFMNLHVIVGGLLLTVLICAGFWLYTQWDTKRFEESLQNSPVMETHKQEATKRQVEHSQKITEISENTEMFPEIGASEQETNKSNIAVPAESTDVAGTTTDSTSMNNFFDQLFEQSIGDVNGSEESTDVSEQVPYDMAVVKAGFDDYNAYLVSNPEYAYQRLDDAFREQYGDDPDVDILVDTIRRGNNGPMTINDAIKWMETMVRLMSKDGVSPPEAVESIKDAIEMLTIAKQMAHEDGVEIKYEGNFHIGE